MRRRYTFVTAILLVALVLAEMVGALSSAISGSDACDGPTARDLECGIERNWDEQVKARHQGPGVRFEEGCSLTQNFKWSPWNRHQKLFLFSKASVDELKPEGTKVRIELVRLDGDVRLAYPDLWALREGTWVSERCEWFEGEPRAPTTELDLCDAPEGIRPSHSC
jgi:hypothetical protein